MMGPDASLTPELIQAQSFTTAFRGYDGAEVKAFLTRVANEMRAWKERAEGLESAWHSAEERAARPPVLDEDTLMAAVGEETAAILRTARAAAAEMRTKAAEEAERTLSEARAEAEQALTEARSEAERALADARAEAERSLTEARSEAERMQREADAALGTATQAAQEQAAALLAAARQDAAEVLERAATEAEDTRAQAEKERQLTIEGANNTRDRILEDLSRRRRVATVQIEQLRAGRERLIESYAVVRRTLEEVQSELSRADAEARAAADDVGRRLRDEREVELSEASRAFTEPSRPAAGAETRAGHEAAAGSPAADELAGVEPGEPAGVEPGAPTVEVAALEEAALDEAVLEEAVLEEAALEEAVLDEAALDRPAAAMEADSLGGGGSAVDELFARIRATRTAGVDDPSAPLAPGEAAANVAEPGGEEPATGATAESPPPAQPAEPPPAQPAEPQPATAGPTESLPAEPTESLDPDATPETRGPEHDATAAARPGRRGAKKRSSPSASNGRHPSPSGPSPTGTAEATRGRARPTVRIIEAKAAAGGEGETLAGDSPEAGSAASSEGEAPVADGDESLMQAREFAVVDLEVNLTRRLKRALQDEQNDVLDRLRNLKGAVTAGALLPDEDAQVTRYAGAARPLLAEAAAAGALFTDETLGLPGRDAPVEVDVSDLAGECGSGIVSPLRRRLEQAIDIGGGDDQTVLVESLGAAYREWKTQRIERLAGDVVAAAFSRGTWEAAPGGARFRWVVEDTDGPCPDCDDDALAGDIPKDEAFPTGQHYPPAHSGCRCLLVPSLSAD